MENNNSRTQSSSTMGSMGQIIGRFVVAAIILGITAFFTPGFSINNIWALAISALVLTAMDYLIVKFTGLHAMAFGKGFVGFVLAVVVLFNASLKLKSFSLNKYFLYFACNLSSYSSLFFCKSYNGLILLK